MIDLESIDESPKPLFILPKKDSEKIEKDKSQRLTEDYFHVMELQWSPNGKEIAFISAPSPKADDIIFKGSIHILDIDTKSIRKLTSHIGGENTIRWSPDGQHIAFLYYTHDNNPLHKDIYIVPAKGGNPINLTKNFDHNEIMISWSPKGDIIGFETFDGLRRHLYAVSKNTGEIRQLTKGDCCNFFISIADDGDTYACYGEAPQKPIELWVGSIKTGKLNQITKLNPQIQNFVYGETLIIKWHSKDGLEIEGLLCLPVGYKEGEKYPLIVEPHGGPHGAIALGFFPFWQYFSGEGFAIFSPNFRGSDGYGADFAKGNYKDWGVGDYQDIMTGVDYLINQGIADPDRLLIDGWSYGGYMTAWIVTQTDRFKAACCGAGLSNLVSMYAQHDIPNFMKLYFEGSSPYQKMELYIKHSPISYINQAKTPTLILHGGEDKRVPVPQAEEFYAGLKAVGVEVEFVKYPREGHTIQEPRHIIDILKRKLEWFKKHI